jgi:Arc/MetJ-type ribon-helix-helix transcriptional regulator
MSDRKEPVFVTDPAYDFARSLVERGEYASVSDAINGEMLRLRDSREADRVLLEAEIRRRRTLPRDQWIEAEPGHFRRWFDENFDGTAERKT